VGYTTGRCASAASGVGVLVTTTMATAGEATPGKSGLAGGVGVSLGGARGERAAAVASSAARVPCAADVSNAAASSYGVSSGESPTLVGVSSSEMA